VAGITVFAGPLDQKTIASTTLLTQFQLTNPAHWAIVLGQFSKRLGLPFLFGLPVACALRSFARTGVRAIRRDHLVMVASLIAATALAYAATPVSARSWDLGPMTPWMGQAIRYAFPFIGLLAVAGALALSGTRVPDEVVVPAVVVAGLVRASSRMMLPAAGLLLLGSVVNRMTESRGKATRALAVCFLGALAVPGLHALDATRDAARARVYGGLPGFIDCNVRSDEVIGYVLSHQSYLLYGSHFDRTVVYVPARGNDRSEWIAGLGTRGIRFLALGPLRPEWRHRKEVAWVGQADGAFTRVFGRDAATEPVLYRLDRR